jgi:hypothetical protein
VAVNAAEGSHGVHLCWGQRQTLLGVWNPFSTLIHQLEEGEKHTHKDYPQDNIHNHENPLVKAGLPDFKVIE